MVKQKRKYTFRKRYGFPVESGSVLHEIDKLGRPSKKKKWF